MTVLVIGNHYWGHADDLAGAKKIFRNQGGILSLGYTIAEFDDDQVFQGVDMMGRASWSNTGDGDVDREPKLTEVKPRNRSR